MSKYPIYCSDEESKITVIDIYGKFIIPTFLAKTNVVGQITNLGHLIQFNKTMTGSIFSSWRKTMLKAPDIVIYDSESKTCTNYDLKHEYPVVILKNGQPMLDLASVNTMILWANLCSEDDYEWYAHKRVDWLSLMVTQKVAKQYEMEMQKYIQSPSSDLISNAIKHRKEEILNGSLKLSDLVQEEVDSRTWADEDS
jgi:hypothetical protein